VKNYINTLNEREKWMVFFTFICLFTYCSYFYIYSPLSNAVTKKSAQLVEKTETLAWMQKVRQLAHSPKTKQSVDNSQLLTLLAAQLKENATLKFPYQLQQTGTGDIQLTFDEVPFKLFMGWLAKINERYTITIKQFDVGPTETPGVTKITIIISARS
jgi:general secretion pathway protein M